MFARLTWIVLHLFIGVPLHLDIGSTVCPTSVCARDKSTLEYCSGASPATKIDKSKCFKTVQACPDEYPDISGDPKDKSSDAPSMCSRGASSKVLPVVVAGAMAALLRDMHA